MFYSPVIHILCCLSKKDNCDKGRHNKQHDSKICRVNTTEHAWVHDEKYKISITVKMCYKSTIQPNINDTTQTTVHHSFNGIYCRFTLMNTGVKRVILIDAVRLNYKSTVQIHV